MSRGAAMDGPRVLRLGLIGQRLALAPAPVGRRFVFRQGGARQARAHRGRPAKTSRRAAMDGRWVPGFEAMGRGPDAARVEHRVRE